MRFRPLRQLSAGLFIPAVVARGARDTGAEMNHRRPGVYLPALHPAEIWQGGRWAPSAISKDRKGADMCLGMTLAEIFTNIARARSVHYKQLPRLVSDSDQVS
jgi:prolyl-tRNA synthetase